MVELALRSTAILGAAWLLTRLMPRATAATRHLVWHAAMAAALAAPLVTPLAPAIPLAVITQVAQVAQVAWVQQVEVTQVPQVAQVRQVPQVAQVQLVQGVRLGEAVGMLATLGSLACVVWFGLGWWVAARVSRRAIPAPLHWQVEVNALCARMGVTREVRLGIIRGTTSPLATGLWRAAILLPQISACWTADRRRAVLVHELAHIRRRDCRAQLLTQAACALYWFNPFVWMAAAHLRSERERACDDEVLRLGALPSSYAADLLDIARDLRPALRPMAGLAMARPCELEGRLLAVLAAGRPRVPARISRWAVATAFGVITIVAFGVTPAQTSQTAPSPATTPRGYVARHDVMMEEDRLATMRDRTTAEQTLERSSDPHDRERAVIALAFSSGRDVIPALVEALRDVDAQVREKAAIGLALRRDARVVEPLIAAMDDSDSQVREKVAIALGTSGDVRAGAALTRALTDPDRQVREKATAALVLLGVTSR
jgi:beta-lactamase regulating signal transducer with metallopeptidase domain